MSKKNFQIPVIIYFLVATALIITLFPMEGKFKFAFVEGRPWHYGLLTAPFDFPVYKTDAELLMEKDSVNSAFDRDSAYYFFDSETREIARQNELRSISPVSGTVQSDEKIIDRGEIVSPKIFNVLRSLKKHYDEHGTGSRHRIGSLTGASLLIIALIACFFFYLYYLRKKIYAHRKDVIFLLLMLSIFTVLTEICVTYKLFDVYIIPYAMIPIVIRTFFDSRTSIMTHNITILLCALMVPSPFEFIVIQYFVCMVVIYVLKDLSRRSELITCSFYILATYILTYVCLLLFEDGGFSNFEWNRLVIFLVNYLFVMFTYAFIYILEKIFGYISNVTLVELSDINKPVLQMLAECCPGTFQHSLQVSMLGAAAAVKVGANPQLVRTGALFHDLGKMENPNYFTENRIEGTDPHKNLTPVESARIITRHVPDGEAIAEKNGLPQAIIHFINTHHGTGKTKFFYNTFKNMYPDAEVDEAAFTYSGSNPDTKETAILMMADSVEATSRSLSDYSEESIRRMVDKIIDGQIADGLLKDAPLTFKNITTIKNVFIEKLITMYHSRISYPELEKK